MQYNGGYPLSIKDMCLASHITEILELGVRSLKIEGRMKSPEYVYGVTKIYRRLLDEKRNASQREIRELTDLFSRSGFTDGYFTKKISGQMNGIRSEADKKATLRTKQSFVPVTKRKEIAPYQRDFDSEPDLSDYNKEKAKKCLSARFYDPESIPKNHPFDIVYLPLERYDEKKANGVLLPPVIYDKDIERIKKQLSACKAEHILITNIGQLDLAKKSGKLLHGDFRLNAFNSLSADIILSLGLEDVILSPELTLAQIRDIILQKSVIIYGAQPLMLLEKRLEQRSLRDRKNADFPLIAEGQRDILFNSQKTYMLDREKELKGAFINNRHFIFTNESQKEVEGIIKSYNEHTPVQGNVRRVK